MKSTWRFVVKIVGASLALAGLVCLVVGCWDKIAACGSSVIKKAGRCSEFDDYDDDFYNE